jgi:hypothetical protein
MNGHHRLHDALHAQRLRGEAQRADDTHPAHELADVPDAPASRSDGAHGGAGVGTRVALARVTPKGPQESSE